MKPLRFPARSQVSALTALCASLLFSFPGCGDDDVNPTTDPEVDASTGNAQTPGNIDGGSGSSGNNGNNGNNGGPGKPNIDATTPGAGGDAASSTDAGNVSSDGSVASDDAGPLQSLDASTSDAAAPGADGGGRRCGTRGGVRCGMGQFCNFEPDTQCGATDRGGLCEQRPEICTQQYQPVCGCNDRTYSNACAAHAAGISVQSTGECARPGRPDAGTGPSSTDSGTGPSAGKMCGGIAGIACGDGTFCNYEPPTGQGCGPIADAAGVCETTPRACTREYNPVCGCNDRTYGNACEAHSNGVSIKTNGACTGNGNGQLDEIECEARGGEVVFGIGPGPRCATGTHSIGSVRLSNGQMPIEGAICCVP